MCKFSLSCCLILVIFSQYLRLETRTAAIREKSWYSRRRTWSLCRRLATCHYVAARMVPKCQRFCALSTSHTACSSAFLWPLKQQGRNVDLSTRHTRSPHWDPLARLGLV